MQECDGDGNDGVVAVSAGNEYMCGTRGSGIMSTCSADSVLHLNLVRGMRSVGGVCEMCMCLARGRVGGEGDKRIGFGL